MGTPQEYRIEHVRDFLTVPKERLDDCLLEFREFLGLGHDAKAAIDALGDTMGVAEACEIVAFTWVDDGKQDKTIVVKVKEAKP